MSSNVYFIIHKMIRDNCLITQFWLTIVVNMLKWGELTLEILLFDVIFLMLVFGEQDFFGVFIR